MFQVVETPQGFTLLGDTQGPAVSTGIVFVRDQFVNVSRVEFEMMLDAWRKSGVRYAKPDEIERIEQERDSYHDEIVTLEAELAESRANQVKVVPLSELVASIGLTDEPEAAA